MSPEQLAFVFPGQGSQSVGMLTALAEHSPRVLETYRTASTVLGYDLWWEVSQGPAEELNRTEKTQPAMLAAGVAVWRAWCDASAVRPSVMAGHSLGEYSALVCAGCLDFEDGVSLVAERGQLMQEAVPEGEGAMAAILGLEDEAVTQVCERAAEGEELAPVNFNSPGQVVIAGRRSAVERALPLAKEAGAKRALLLPVSVPSHCALMESAATQMNQSLAQVTLKTPEIPVIHNVDVKVHTDPAEIREALSQQMHKPVRWADTVRAMGERGVTTLVECGPGKVLAGLTKRIDRALIALPVFDPATLAAALEKCNES